MRRNNSFDKSIFLFFYTIALLSFYFLWPNQSSKKIQINIHHWTKSKQPSFQKVAEIYSRETGVELKFRYTSDPGLYPQEISQSIDENRGPNAFRILYDNYTVSHFANRNVLVDLSELYSNQRWFDRMDPIALERLKFENENRYHARPGIYGFPLEMTFYMVTYNKLIFLECGLNPEAEIFSWNDFIRVRDALEACGKKGFVLGAASDSILLPFIINCILNNLPVDQVRQTFQGHLSYDTPEWLQSFKTFEVLKSNSKTAPGIDSANKSQEDFLSEKTAIIYEDSDFSSVLSQVRPDINYGVFRLPTLIDQGRPYLLMTPGSILYVNNLSEHRDETLRFLKWISSDFNANQLAADMQTMSAFKSARTKISPKIKNIYNSNVYPVDPFKLIEAEDRYIIELMLLGVRKILKSEMSADQVIKMLEKSRLIKVN